MHYREDLDVVDAVLHSGTTASEVLAGEAMVTAKAEANHRKLYDALDDDEGTEAP